jgi:hypothetical protein
MFTKIRNTMLALAAVATLGAASLVTTTTSADARGFGGGFSRGGGMHMGGGMRMGGRHFGGQRLIGGNSISRTPRFVHHRPHIRPDWCRFRGRCGIHVRWHRPWIYGTGVATTYAVSPAIAAAPAPSCTCLSKEYTPDNLVVFKDVCTKEVASAPIGNTQAQLPMPQQQMPTQQ